MQVMAIYYVMNGLVLDYLLEKIHIYPVKVPIYFVFKLFTQENLLHLLSLELIQLSFVSLHTVPQIAA